MANTDKMLNYVHMFQYCTTKLVIVQWKRGAYLMHILVSFDSMSDLWAKLCTCRKMPNFTPNCLKKLKKLTKSIKVNFSFIILVFIVSVLWYYNILLQYTHWQSKNIHVGKENQGRSLCDIKLTCIEYSVSKTSKSFNKGNE